MATNDISKNFPLSQPQLYEVCAPTVYGKILSMVQQVPIADMLHQKLFIKAFSEKDYFNRSPHSPLLTLLNDSHKKSLHTMKALSILRDCCESSGVCVTGKK